MKDVYYPSWLIVVDESMVANLNPLCPGWLNVKRKPHPFGNEYHTSADQETRIIFATELVETLRDKPVIGPYANKPLTDSMSPTAALVCHMTRAVWGTGRVVGLDSGFGDIPAAVKLLKHGLYCTAQIKKKAYWPAGTKAQEMIQELAGKEVGTIMCREGSKGGENFWISGLADSKHISIMLNMWGTSIRDGKWKYRRVGGQLIKFRYGQNGVVYYACRHGVDDNNNRMGRLSFEFFFPTAGRYGNSLSSLKIYSSKVTDV